MRGTSTRCRSTVCTSGNDATSSRSTRLTDSSPHAKSSVYCLYTRWRSKFLIIKITRRWHVTISCQPDGRPPQPFRPWKSGRVHLAEDSNVVVLELPYSTEFGRESRKSARGSENIENLMTVVDRLDELQASSVGRRECSSIRQRTGARHMDVHVDT